MQFPLTNCLRIAYSLFIAIEVQCLYAQEAHEVMTLMSTQEAFVRQFAKLFVHYQEALTLTKLDSAEMNLEPWQDMPQVERERLVAAARLALLELEADDRSDSRRWYARPGEAEWGC